MAYNGNFGHASITQAPAKSISFVHEKRFTKMLDRITSWINLAHSNMFILAIATMTTSAATILMVLH